MFLNFQEEKVSTPPPQTKHLLSCSLHRGGYLQINLNLAPRSQPRTKLA